MAVNFDIPAKHIYNDHPEQKSVEHPISSLTTEEWMLLLKKTKERKEAVVGTSSHQDEVKHGDTYH